LKIEHLKPKIKVGDFPRGAGDIAGILEVKGSR
jgi:hypothetical protein